MMKKFQNPQLFGGTLVILLVCCLFLPVASAEDSSGNEWKVRPGDTLYAIGRAVFPGDTRKQARLRQDIINLNPIVFAHGANNMKVGVVLKLPPYVTLESVQSEVGEPAPKPTKVTPKSEVSSVSAAKTSGTVWKVRSGDTLYGICRTIYPDDARRQAQLGRDIKKLNPSVFPTGANYMRVGIALKLPDYVAPERVPSEAGVPESAPMTEKGVPGPESASIPVPEEVTPEAEQQPLIPPPVAEAKPETPAVKEELPSSPSQAEGRTVVSFGYSNGGDKLANVLNGPDIRAGNGVQLRLGYEQMFQNASGYRASLGVQYYRLFSGGASYRDIYLQFAYQYQANPVLFGIGVVADTGAKLENNINYSFDPAIGGTVYLEYIGSGIWDGLGLGATSLSIKEKNSGTSFNASRLELYYRWRF